MQSKSLLPVLAAIVVLLAGCTASPSAPADNGGSAAGGSSAAPSNETATSAPSGSGPANAAANGSAPAKAPQTTKIPINFVVSVGVPGAAAFATSGDGGNFDVSNGTTLVLAEAKWTCVSPTCDLTLIVGDPSGATKGQGTGSATAKATVDKPAAGSWMASLFANTAAAQVTGEIRVTTFEGPMPSGFSAFSGNATSG